MSFYYDGIDPARFLFNAVLHLEEHDERDEAALVVLHRAAVEAQGGDADPLGYRESLAAVQEAQRAFWRALEDFEAQHGGPA